MKEYKNQLERYLDEMKRVDHAQYSVDTSQFKAPIADNIQWTPVKRGGNRYRSHRLVVDKDGNANFKLSLHAVTHLLTPLMFCVFLVWVGKAWWALLISPIILLNLVRLIRNSETISFSFQTGYYTNAHVQCLISDIHAHQIIREEVHTDDSTDICYELNIS